MSSEAVELQLKEAFQEWSQGRIEKALRRLESVIRRYPDHFDALKAAGVVSYELGDIDKAKDLLQRANDISPANAECAENLAGLLLQSNQPEEAERILCKAISLNNGESNLDRLQRIVDRQLKLRRLSVEVISKSDFISPSAEVNPLDFDSPFSIRLKEALARRGLPVNQANPRVFILLHGIMPSKIDPKMYKIIWVHSNPYEVTLQKLFYFDHIFSQSIPFVEKLKSTGISASPLIGAGALELVTSSDLSYDIAYVGDAPLLDGRRVLPPILNMMISLGDKWLERLSVWGMGWESLLPEFCLKKEAIESLNTKSLLPAAKVLLVSHLGFDADEGFFNPSLIDAMSSGSVVLSDAFLGNENFFGDTMSVCHTSEELDNLLCKCFEDDGFYQELARKNQQVASQYSFDKVADRIVDHILAIDEVKLEQRYSRLRIEGNEAWVTFQKELAIKTYKPEYFIYNQKYQRRGEEFYLRGFPSEYFIRVKNFQSGRLEMFDGGLPIGRRNPNVERQYVLEPDGLNLSKLVVWLKSLGCELRRLGLKHRDLNPSNILYDCENDKYSLIDFGWMIKDTDSDDDSTHLDNLNPYAPNDTEAINGMIVDVIQSQIERINTGEHYEGSSVNPGWVYHPIPFDEFSTRVHKFSAIEEFKELVEYCGINMNSKLRVLEIGSAVGYFSFSLAKMACDVTSFEFDPEACQVAESVRVFKGIENVNFINSTFEISSLERLESDFDLTLMLNVHMWIHKQLGHEKTIELMRSLSKRTKRLFFQTAHAESGGMYLVMELKTAEDVGKYLESCGFTNVRHLRDTKAHGGIRSLFLCEGSH